MGSKYFIYENHSKSDEKIILQNLFQSKTFFVSELLQFNKKITIRSDMKRELKYL